MSFDFAVNINNTSNNNSYKQESNTETAKRQKEELAERNNKLNTNYNYSNTQISLGLKKQALINNSRQKNNYSPDTDLGSRLDITA